MAHLLGSQGETMSRANLCTKIKIPCNTPSPSYHRYIFPQPKTYCAANGHVVKREVNWQNHVGLPRAGLLVCTTTHRIVVGNQSLAGGEAIVILCKTTSGDAQQRLKERLNHKANT